MLLTIDFLILNFKGTLTKKKNGLNTYSEDYPNPFSLVKHEYGNKTFKDMYDIFYYNNKIGLLNASPRGVVGVSSPDLIQFQFENHLFYTNTLRDLGQLVHELLDYFDIKFEGINRLDIAIDKKENSIKYRDLYFDLMSGRKLVKGREKTVSAYSKTKQGRANFGGFTIGERKSSRYLRVYNKTLDLSRDITQKQYITEWHNKNNLQSTPGLDIWRFEYQLNSTFFTYLRKYKQNITYQIFDMDTLVDLLEMAQKNHFEIVESTGKTETNKEKQIVLHNWSLLRENLRGVYTAIVSKIRRVFEPTIVIQKRLIKGLFRNYYITQDVDFVYPMCKTVNHYKLRSWFEDKYQFYIREFRDKEKICGEFNEEYFIELFNQLTDDNINHFELEPELLVHPIGYYLNNKTL